MKTRSIGTTTVSEIGLGGMPMSIEGRPDEARSIATIHGALDAGITLIDTADAYTPSDRGPGMNEEVVARALAAYGGSTDQLVVATKGGHTRDGGDWGVNGRPEYLRAACEDSLRRLRIEAIGLYQHHRPDPEVPYEETMGGLKDLYDAGLVERVGISNADSGQIEVAADILGAALVSVQNQFSPAFRSSEPEIATCDSLGIAFLPWSPLGGASGAKDLGSTYAPFAQVADDRGVSPQQVCLAWLLSLSPVCIPIPGASRPESIRDSVPAAELALEPADLTALSG